VLLAGHPRRTSAEAERFPAYVPRRLAQRPRPHGRGLEVSARGGNGRQIPATPTSFAARAGAHSQKYMLFRFKKERI